MNRNHGTPAADKLDKHLAQLPPPRHGRLFAFRRVDPTMRFGDTEADDHSDMLHGVRVEPMPHRPAPRNPVVESQRLMVALVFAGCAAITVGWLALLVWAWRYFS